ncbi:MAG: GPW/gp25 family protein [Gammaproteobacteria bacterium]
MAAGKDEFLGCGWKFPLQVNAKGGIAKASDAQRIEESIYVILGTSPGERVMQPEFGCGIQDLVFAPNNAATLGLVANRVQKSLVRYEPRINLLNVNVETAPDQPNLLLIRIDYRIRASNAFGNLVYPFYITEGG